MVAARGAGPVGDVLEVARLFVVRCARGARVRVDQSGLRRVNVCLFLLGPALRLGHGINGFRGARSRRARRFRRGSGSGRRLPAGVEGGDEVDGERRVAEQVAKVIGRFVLGERRSVV